MFTVKHFRMLQLLITLGLILSIAGGTSGTIQPDGTVKVATTSKVGIALYIVAFVALTFVYFASVSRTYCVPAKERRVPVAIAFALPFILVRLVYSACAVFLHSHLFNIVTGNVIVLVVMAIVEEFTVVVIYILLGFTVDKLEKGSAGKIAGRKWKAKKNRLSRRDKAYAAGEPEAQRLDLQGYQGPTQPQLMQQHGVMR